MTAALCSPSSGGPENSGGALCLQQRFQVGKSTLGIFIFGVIFSINGIKMCFDVGEEMIVQMCNAEYYDSHPDQTPPFLVSSQCKQSLHPGNTQRSKNVAYFPLFQKLKTTESNPV